MLPPKKPNNQHHPKPTSNKPISQNQLSDSQVFGFLQEADTAARKQERQQRLPLAIAERQRKRTARTERQAKEAQARALNQAKIFIQAINQKQKNPEWMNAFLSGALASTSFVALFKGKSSVFVLSQFKKLQEQLFAQNPVLVHGFSKKVLIEHKKAQFSPQEFGRLTARLIASIISAKKKT